MSTPIRKVLAAAQDGGWEVSRHTYHLNVCRNGTTVYVSFGMDGTVTGAALWYAGGTDLSDDPAESLKPGTAGMGETVLAWLTRSYSVSPDGTFESYHPNGVLATRRWAGGDTEVYRNDGTLAYSTRDGSFTVHHPDGAPSIVSQSDGVIATYRPDGSLESRRWPDGHVE